MNLVFILFDKMESQQKKSKFVNLYHWILINES